MAAKQIKYLNRQFDSLKTDLINFTKTYFPTTYNDFGQASVGMMFMQLSAYVGDVLSYYLDNNLQQMFLQYAQNQNSIMRIAQMYGYKLPITTAANVTLDISITVPTDGTDILKQYIPIILPNTIVRSVTNSSVKFLIQQSIPFYTDTDQLLSISQGTGNFVTITKQVPAISAQIQTVQIQCPTDIIQY